MKRILWVVVILLAAGAVMYAQQAQPSAAQIKQDAQNYLNQAKNNSSQFDSMLNELRLRNGAGLSINTLNQLKADIERLEARIKSEADGVTSVLDRGNKVYTERLDFIEQLINLHRSKQNELAALIASAK